MNSSIRKPQKFCWVPNVTDECANVLKPKKTKKGLGNEMFAAVIFAWLEDLGRVLSLRSRHSFHHVSLSERERTTDKHKLKFGTLVSKE